MDVAIGQIYGDWRVEQVLEGDQQQALTVCVGCGGRRLFTRTTLEYSRYRPCGRCDPVRKEEFWARVLKIAPTPSDPSPCWPWQGPCNREGYGSVSINDVGRGAHRVAWEMHNGRVARDGYDICHSCNNPPCCNPDHLSEGTHEDNIKYRVDCGRSASGSYSGRVQQPEAYAHLKGEGHWARSCPEKVKVGTKHWAAIKSGMTPERAHQIRQEYLAGQGAVTQGMLGLKYGLTQAHISDIVINRVWPEPGGDVRALVAKSIAERSEQRDAAIRADLVAGVTQKAICEKYGVSLGIFVRLLGRGKYKK